MQQEYEVVIADTSCFILLDKIDEIQLLEKIFSSITTTQTIAEEFGKPLPDWVNVLSVQNKPYQHLLELEVDAGEASAFALSVEYAHTLLIIDDMKARKLADKLLLNYTGTLGILLKAKELNIISFIKPVLSKIQLTNFRFSQKVFEEILTIAQEK
jgi:predicted nucleic acid-binding protein